jgi:hypothetical protein
MELTVMSKHFRRRSRIGLKEIERFLLCVLIFGLIEVAPLFGQSYANSPAGDVDCSALLRRQEVVIDNLLRIERPDSLRIFFSSLPTNDQVLQIVYYTRISEIGYGDSATEGLLKAMPQNQLEFTYFYEMCNSRLKDDWANRRLNEIACGYYERVAKALFAERRYVQSFFRMGFVSDGEIFYLYASACAWLFDRDCVWFLQNLLLAHPQIEQNVIGALKLGLASRTCFDENKDRIPSRYRNMLKFK